MNVTCIQITQNFSIWRHSRSLNTIINNSLQQSILNMTDYNPLSNHIRTNQNYENGYVVSIAYQKSYLGIRYNLCSDSLIFIYLSNYHTINVLKYNCINFVCMLYYQWAIRKQTGNLLPC